MHQIFFFFQIDLSRGRGEVVSRSWGRGWGSSSDRAAEAEAVIKGGGGGSRVVADGSWVGRRWVEDGRGWVEGGGG